MMAAFRLLALLAALLALLATTACDAGLATDGRFVALDIFIDAGDESVAAWQLEFVSTTTTIVGVEGGDAPFDEPAHYDSRALHGKGRIVPVQLPAK